MKTPKETLEIRIPSLYINIYILSISKEGGLAGA
jgi:hypothetical protein